MESRGSGEKYYLQPGRTQPSFSVAISDTPAVAANRMAKFDRGGRKEIEALGG
jgi:hypothetical protein